MHVLCVGLPCVCVCGLVALLLQAPAGFQHTVIMRDNITICGTQEFLDGNCTHILKSTPIREFV
jgi:hypothetical protein